MRASPLVALEYRPRIEVEERLRSALRNGGPVLLVGSSMVGKSKIAAEVPRKDFPRLRLYRPATPDGLAQLLEHGTPQHSVVSLDGLERHLTSTELRTDWLQQLTARGLGNVVVATIRRKGMEIFQAEGEVRHPQARVVQGGIVKTCGSACHATC